MQDPFIAFNAATRERIRSLNGSRGALMMDAHVHCGNCDLIACSNNTCLARATTLPLSAFRSRISTAIILSGKAFCFDLCSCTGRATIRAIVDLADGPRAFELPPVRFLVLVSFATEPSP